MSRLKLFQSSSEGSSWYYAHRGGLPNGKRYHNADLGIRVIWNKNSSSVCSIISEQRWRIWRETSLALLIVEMGMVAIVREIRGGAFNEDVFQKWLLTSEGYAKWRLTWMRQRKQLGNRLRKVRCYTLFVSDDAAFSFELHSLVKPNFMQSKQQFWTQLLS